MGSEPTSLRPECVLGRFRGWRTGTRIWRPEDFPEELQALLVDDVAELRDSFEQVQALWAATIDRARGFSEEQLHESVAGEWSFVRTLRHVIYAIDTWVGRVVLDESARSTRGASPSASTPTPSSTSPWTSTPSRPSTRCCWSTPSGWASVRDLLAGLSNTDLDRVCTPDDTTHPSEPHTVRECVLVVVEEGWWHNGFANRDLDALVGGPDRRRRDESAGAHGSTH